MKDKKKHRKQTKGKHGQIKQDFWEDGKNVRNILKDEADGYDVISWHLLKSCRLHYVLIMDKYRLFVTDGEK